MFYRPKDGHGLPHNPFNAVVSPRPIGWISTRASDGSENLAPYSFFNAIVSPRPIGWISTRGTDGSENLAPYSFFNAVAYVPPQVMFASTSTKPDRDGTKDSVANIRETGVFCVNTVAYEMRDAMNRTSGPWDKETDEFTLASIDRADCDTIACSRVARAPASLECRMSQIIQIAGEANFMVLGEVTGIHLRDDCLKDGRFDVTAYEPLARLGYRDYTRVTDLFSLQRPDD